jgi:hypothetical protein
MKAVEDRCTPVDQVVLMMHIARKTLGAVATPIVYMLFLHQIINQKLFHNKKKMFCKITFAAAKRYG